MASTITILNLFIFLGVLNLVNVKGIDNQIKIRLVDSGNGVYGLVKVGTPAQVLNFQIRLDTDQISITVDECRPKEKIICDGKVLNPNISSTFELVIPNFSPNQARDDFASVGIKGQTFFVYHQRNFTIQPAVLGLNIDKNAKNEYPTLLENMNPSNVTKFWFNLRGFKEVVANNFRDGRVGELVFGDPDPSSYKSPVRYVPKKSSFNWQFDANVTIGKLNLCHNCLLSFDTNVRGIILPVEKYSNVKKSILDAFKPGCSDPSSCSLSSFPPLEFRIGETILFFSPEEYIFPVKYGNDTIRTIFEKGHQSVILGRAFLAKYFVEFDFARERIGFAERNSLSTKRNSSSSIKSSIFLIFSLILWKFIFC